MAAAAEPKSEGERGPIDQLLAAAVLLLVGFGIVMIYSSSAVFAERALENSRHFLDRQIVWVGVGLATMIVTATIGYRAAARLALPLLLTTVVLMVVVLTPVGSEVGGARRWLHFGPVAFQPGELAKLTMSVWLAYSLTRKATKIRSFTIGFVPHMLIAGLLIGLSLMEPDLGTAALLAAVTMTMVFVAGGKIIHLLGALLPAAALLYIAVITSPYRMARIRAFLDPFQHRFGEGYQVTESLLGFGAGGLFGLGLGDGRQKLFFLPEAHNDFIASQIGEELGFVGVVATLAVFGVIVWRGMRIAFRRPNTFGGYLAFGLTLLIGLQALVNIAVALGLIPTKGLNLPYVSYGGSSLVFNMAAAGILLDISRGGQCPLQARVADSEEVRSTSKNRLVRRRVEQGEG
jgi:cell division protein FtsW